MEDQSVREIPAADAKGSRPPSIDHPNSGKVVPDRRRMHQAELLGGHSHNAANGVGVHVYVRDGRYLARGRCQGRPFGVTLGRGKREAESALRRLLTEIEDGKFRRRSDRPSRFLGPPRVQSLTLRELCDACLQEKRKLRGLETARTYQQRLSHVLDFAERSDAFRHWPLARDIDRDFVIDLRIFLVQRQVSRNGRSVGRTQPMSDREVRNILQALRLVLTWGARADVRHLPAEFVNPLTAELIGRAPVKDPLRAVPLQLQERIKILEQMDDWQFMNLSVLLVLPLRPEDAARALISDLDLNRRSLKLGTHFGGIDFSKGRVDVTMPLPSELVQVFQLSVRDRAEGPLFLRRRSSKRRPRAFPIPKSRDEVQALFADTLAKFRREQIQAPEDQKRVFCNMLRKLGGVTTDQIAKEIRKLLSAVAVPTARAYDLRHGVSQDMHSAGIRHLELRYLTGHTTRDILHEYIGLDPRGEIEKYFTYIRLLLDQIGKRAARIARSEPSR